VHKSVYVVVYCVIAMHLTVGMFAGSPFSFIVADPDKVYASGDGLDMVRAGKLATFFISAPAGRLCDFCVKITGRQSFTLVFTIILFDLHSMYSLVLITWLID